MFERKVHSKVQKKTVLVAALTALLVAALPLAASAAFDKSELKCRKALAKGVLKTLSTADKTSIGCHKSRHKDGSLVGTDCNDLGPEPGTPGAADLKQKFAKAQQKLIDTPAKKCAGLDGDILGEFISCPEPCNTDLGLANPLSTIDEVAQCLACVAGDVVSARNAVTLGTPDPTMMSGDDVKCAQAIGKGYAKHLSTILKTRTKCQDTADKNGAMALDSVCQSDPDPDGKGKIAKALAKAEAGVDKSCTTADLNNVGSCATTNLTDLKACLASEDADADTSGFPAHYELDPTVCPIAMDSTVLAGTGAGGSTTATNLESGWNGIGHNQDLVDRYTLSASLTCAGSPPCGSCTIDGLDSAGPQYDDFARCAEDVRISCTNPFGTDGVCPGAQECGYYTGPPLPASSSNVPVCIITRLNTDIAGTVNPDDGSGEQQLDLRSIVHLGINLTKPCPFCENDTTPQDGSKDGICSGGLNDGFPCDVQGFNSTFAPTSGVSLDCPPSNAQNISGAGLELQVDLTTGSVSLPFGTSCDFPLGAESCACAVCSGDTTLACNSDLECSMAGAGTCSSPGSGASRRPNGCSDQTCTDIGGEKGECQNGMADDTVMYCDGHLRANGGGLITCLSNADCSTVNSVCNDNDCGTCSIMETRPCFLDPILASGTPDTEQPILAGAFCTPPTTNTGVNGATGLPGPTRATIESNIDFRY